MKRLILPALALLLVLPAPAHAGNYDVYGCETADGYSRPMRPFGPFEVPLDSMNHDELCQTAAHVGYFEWAPGMLLTAGRRGGYVLDAPPGTAFTDFGWLGWASGLSGTGIHVEIARGDDGATLWDFGGDVGVDQRRYPLPPGTTTIVLRQVCRATVCAIGAAPARTSTRSLFASLNDAAPPTANGFTGALTATGARHGTVGLTFTAADVGAGLTRASLTVDGSARGVVLDDSASCRPLSGDPRGFETVSPCARSAPVELTWSTAAVADGAHTVSAKVEDASGNVSTVFGPVTVTTDNVPPVAGVVTVTRAAQVLTATAIAFAGQDVAYAYRWQRCDPDCDDIDGATRNRYTLTAADAGHAVRAVVTASDLGGATTARSEPVAIEPTPTPTPTPTATPSPTATATATPPAPCAGAPDAESRLRSRGCAAPVAAPTPAPATPLLTSPPCPLCTFSAPPAPRVSLSRRTIKTAYGRRVEVRGRITATNGTPVAGATLDVGAKLRMRGAKARREGRIGSASDGRFTYVAPAGASRDLKIGTATVSLLVTAAGTLHASRHGALVRFSGRVRGGHLPRGGVLVEIRAGSRVVALVRTDGHGAYRATRRATRQSFRARTRADSSWPFVAAPMGSPVSA